jgi:hypothetical protein
MVFLRRFEIPAFVGVLALAFAVAANAQVTTGTIFGRVADSTGAVVPGATVTATNTATATTKSTVTNTNGEFTLPFLTVGPYTVTVTLTGFKTHTETGLQVSSGDKLSLSYTLEVGAMSEVVTVETETPLLNSASSEENVRLSNQMVAELPMLNRDITALLNQGTGLATGGSGAELSINGMPTRGFTFTIDGVDATQDAEFPSLGMYQNFNNIKGTSLEAVKEVEVSKNVFSAEIGMAMAGNVNIISKSGTNKFHGSGFWGYQNGEWNSEDFITGLKATGTYNSYGGSIGGPIIKDKLFFFGAYEGYSDEREEPNSGNVPSRQVRAIGTAGNPPTQSYWDIWPLPTADEAPGATQARFEGIFPRTADDNHFIGRLDYNISANDLLTVRYSRGRPNFLDPSLAIGNSRDRRGEVENFAGTYTRIFGPTVTSEFRFGYNKNRTERIDLMWENEVINLDVDGVPSAGGEALIKYGTTSSFENTWSWVKGRHSFKFGGLARFWRGSRFNEETPTYEFSSVADLIANDADRAEYQFALEDFQINSFDAGVFVQDDIRVNADLMLNAGIRWDYSGVPNERDKRMYNRVGPFGGADAANPGIVQYRDPDDIYEPYYGMVSPRLGFAWTLNEETVIRGGAGIFFQPFNLFAGPVEIIQNSLGEPVEFVATGEQLDDLGIQYPATSDVVRPLVSGPCDETNYTCPQDDVFITDSALDLNRKNPYSVQWSIGVSRRLSETLAFDIGYVGNVGERLTFSPENNRADRVTGLAPVANFGLFRHYTQEDSSTYHSLQTSLRRRFQNGFGFGVHYTYASNLTYFLGEFTCCGNTEQPQEINNDLSNNRGPSAYYNRHRFFADALWELPLGQGMLAKGWQLGLLLEVRSGGMQLILDRGSRGAGDRPDFLSSDLGDAIVDDWTNEIAPNTWQYLDPTAFARVPRNPSGYQSRSGESGRRSITGPGFWAADMNLSKRFTFSSGFSFQLRAEVFNAFNNKNYGNPQTRIERTDFGQITSIGAPRQWQFGVRFDF